MARIGDSVNAGLGLVSYAPLMASNARASERTGMALQQGIGAVGDAIVDKKDQKTAVKTAEARIKAAMELFGDDMGHLTGVSEQLQNEEIPLSQRAALGKQIDEMLGMGIAKMKNDQALAMQNRGFAIDEANLGMRRQEFDFNMDQAVQTAQQQQKERGLQDAMIQARATPLLGSALEQVKQLERAGGSSIFNSKEIAKVLESDASDAEKLALANDIYSMLPAENVSEPFNVPATINGQPGEIPVIFDRNSRTLIQLPIAGQGGGGGGYGLDARALPSGLQPYAEAFNRYGAEYGVDPKVLAAISMHETANGTSSAFRNKKNAMGISNSKGPMQMESVEQSIERMAKLLGSTSSGPYKGASTLPEIARIYAPPGAGNDPRGLNQYWTKGVASNLQRLGGDAAAPIRITPGAVSGPQVDPVEELTKLVQLEKTQLEVEEKKGAMQAADAKEVGVVQQAEDQISLIDGLLEHPGFNAAFGASIGKTVGALPIVPDVIPGSDRADALAMVDQLKGQAFLSAVKQMKGMGQLSDAEGKKLEQAAARLDTAQSDSAARKSLEEMKAVLERAKAQSPAAAQQTGTDSDRAALRARMKAEMEANNSR